MAYPTLLDTLNVSGSSPDRMNLVIACVCVTVESLWNNGQTQREKQTNPVHEGVAHLSVPSNQPMIVAQQFRRVVGTSSFLKREPCDDAWPKIRPRAEQQIVAEHTMFGQRSGFGATPFWVCHLSIVRRFVCSDCFVCFVCPLIPRSSSRTQSWHLVSEPSTVKYARRDRPTSSKIHRSWFCSCHHHDHHRRRRCRRRRCRRHQHRHQHQHQHHFLSLPIILLAILGDVHGVGQAPTEWPVRSTSVLHPIQSCFMHSIL